MSEQAQETRVGFHPRFLLTQPIQEQFRVSLNMRLLGEVATVYGLAEPDINETSITATHERDMTWSRDPAKQGEVFGSMSRIIRQSADESVHEERAIKIHITPHVSASFFGILVHEARIDTKVKDLFNTNLSATLIHELGHLAAHVHNKHFGSKTLFPLRFGALARPGGDHATREEWWVRDETRRIVRKHPELRRLITAEKR